MHLKPRIPEPLLDAVADAIPAPTEVARFKCHLDRGRTVYGVVIDRRGFIQRLGERPVYSAADLGFSVAAIQGLERY